MKILNIIRHAKSIQNNSIKNDIYRTITKIGKIDADFLNRYLVQYNFKKHKILCSTSLRTKQTLECFKYSLNNESKIVYYQDLYLANFKEIIKTISLESKTSMLTIVGHNPGVSDLLSYLSGNFSLDDMPTSSMAQLEFSKRNKTGLHESSAKINFYIQSKDNSIINLLT